MQYSIGYVHKGDILSPDRRTILSLHNAKYWLGKTRDRKTVLKMAKGRKGKTLGLRIERINILCKYCGKKFKVRITDYIRRQTEFCSKKHYSKWQEKNTCGTASPVRKGKTSKNNLLRMRKKYRIWRDKVFKRDKYTCQDCGKHSGINQGIVHLSAHHKKSFAENPLLRYKVSNGITLCRKCHSKIHNGRKVK